ncbi:EF-hand domain-containing protein [Streptomyces sp. NPDC088757]|uniref:EF-hand domain-containing protein n=1 Tax=Streptomyces sp. NPDC088757 TaxID=3365889 RepID=UPI00382B95C7
MTMAIDNVAQERLAKRFDKWDADGNGLLEPSDFAAEAADIARAFGESPESPKASALRDGFVALFGDLARRAGVAPEGSIDREQFLRAAGEIVQGGAATFDPAFSPVAKGIVGLADRDGDGVIDGNEFATWLKALGLGEAEAREAFRQIDTDGDGTLSEQELLAAVRKFHLGELDVELLG